MEEWKTYKLSEIGTIVGGATPSTKVAENYDGDIPWITPKDLSSFSGRFIEQGERNITQRGFDSCSCQMLPKNSVLFSSRAPIGYVAIAAVPLCTNQGFKSVVPNEEIVDPRFLYYLLKFNKDRIAEMGSGTTFMEVSGGVMKNVEVSLPELMVQEHIADVLSSIDEKIELNNRINHNLEEQANCLISSAIETRSIGSAHLRDICSYVLERVNCGILKKENYISTDNMFANRGGIGIASTIPGGKCTSFKAQDILVSNIRPYFKKIWRASFSGGCSNDVLCFRTTIGTSSFLYHLLRSDAFFEYVMSGAKGSKMPRGDKQHILNWEVPVFEKLYLAFLEGSLKVIDDRVAIIQEENRRLSAIRDSLLPILMNNGVRLSDLTC